MTTASRTAKPLWLQFKEAGATPADIIEYFDAKLAPVPVIAFANALGVRVLKSYSLDKDGELYFEDEERRRPVITTNARQHINRRRFTVAHELGHLMMHELKNHNRDTDDCIYDPIETEANVFAANLLMPRSILDRYIGLGMVDLNALARHFKVSPAAMSIRLQNL